MSGELFALLAILINDGITESDKYRMPYQYTLIWNKDIQMYILSIWYHTKKLKCCCLTYQLNKYKMRAIKQAVK